MISHRSILGGQDEFLPVLKGFMRPEDIPRCYGGEDDTPFGEKDDHVAFREYAYAVTKRGRVPSTSSSNGHGSNNSSRSGADVERERTWSSGSSQASGSASNGSGSNAGSSHGSSRASNNINNNNNYDHVSSAPSRRRLNSKDPDGFYSYVCGHANDSSIEAQQAHHGGSGYYDRGSSSSSSAATSGWNYNHVNSCGDSDEEINSSSSSWSNISRALYTAQNATLAVVARFACCIGVLVCYAIRYCAQKKGVFHGSASVSQVNLLTKVASCYCNYCRSTVVGHGPLTELLDTE